jgi:hypothetical protein
MTKLTDSMLIKQKREPDHEVQMARSELYRAGKISIELHSLLSNVSERQGLEGWVQAKITKAADYLETVYHYLDYELAEPDHNLSEVGPVAPGSVPAGSSPTPSNAPQGTAGGAGNAQEQQQQKQQQKQQQPAADPAKQAADLALRKKALADQIKQTQIQLQNLQKQQAAMNKIQAGKPAPPMAIHEMASAGASAAGGVASSMGAGNGFLYGGPGAPAVKRRKKKTAESYYGSKEGPSSAANWGDFLPDPKDRTEPRRGMDDAGRAAFDNSLKKALNPSTALDPGSALNPANIIPTRESDAKKKRRVANESLTRSLREVQSQFGRPGADPLIGREFHISQLDLVDEELKAFAAERAPRMIMAQMKDGNKYRLESFGNAGIYKVVAKDLGEPSTAQGLSQNKVRGGGTPAQEVGIEEMRTRLDPKCWKGKHKEGTKIKGGIRVNNCVPNEGVEESANTLFAVKVVDPKTGNEKTMEISALTATEAKSKVAGRTVEVDGEKKHYKVVSVKSAWDEAANPAQQAAIAIAKKKKKGMKEGETGPKFTGYYKGTDKGKPGKKMVGSS